MKIKLIILCVVFAATAAAQSFQKKQFDINLGAGFGNTFMHESYETKMPFLHATFELGISDAISLGAYISYAKADWALSGTENCNSGNGNGNDTYQYVYTHKATHLIVALKPAFHFGQFLNSDNIDLYGGLLLGSNFESDEYTLETNPYCDKVKGLPFPFETYDGFMWAIYGGARFRFSENVGIFGEAGYGITTLNAGINFKL